jgi:DNA-binding PadR family transcriptional regulator
MTRRRDQWDFGDFFRAGFGRGFGPGGEWNARGRGWRRRGGMFESGEMKFVILRLLREKPRHGYEIIKALEEKTWGWYSPSAGTIYPTLQLLEDQGYVRAVEADGKKVYHVTRDGERYLDEHRDIIDDITDRIRDAMRDFTGGAMGDLNAAFGSVARATYKRVWRKGPEHPGVKRVAEILRKTAEEIDREWDADSGPAATEP